jgi:26S proteasome regulatory subunit N6
MADQAAAMDTDNHVETATEGADEFQYKFEQIETSDCQSNDKIGDYLSLLQNVRSDEAAIKIKEQCIYRIAKMYTEQKQFAEVANILKGNGDFFGAIPKARTAKIVRNMLNIVATVQDSLSIQIELCQDVIAWCKFEKRTFLRQRIEAKLAALFLQRKEPLKAMTLIDELLTELRRLDDKQMLTEVHLTESRVYHALQNIPKSKASLTACRTAANAIYVTPLLQAEIDEMSGILHCEETDYTTSFSYFLEAFDAYDQNNQPKSALSCLKYMILAKVLNNASNEVPSLLASKLALNFLGSVDLEAMSEIASAAKAKSLESFRKVTKEYSEHLRSDPLIDHNLDILYDKMLESNLLRIIHPYNVVEIEHIAKLINMTQAQVVQKLSQMVLDQKLSGILDEGRGQLIIYDTSSEDASFSRSLEIIGNLGSVVEALFHRANGLSKVQ